MFMTKMRFTCNIPFHNVPTDINLMDLVSDLHKILMFEKGPAVLGYQKMSHYLTHLDGFKCSDWQGKSSQFNGLPISFRLDLMHSPHECCESRSCLT